jgi:Acyl-CoA dehydrogenase, C-terminal domain
VLNIGRLKLGARSVGTIKLSLGQSVKYAKERHQFGRPIASFGLIKHKLAEMTIRAYVGESILYRTAGMIDEALEAVDKYEPKQMLGVLEQYAVECSIIKVWESEALGYVVDEQVQVFGGYGYSKDYPAERAYRDARIARIYEGTSEINRIVIGSQLLRRAKAGEIGILEASARILDGGGASIDTCNQGQLSVERNILSGAKAMTLAAFGMVDRAYGDSVRDEQEALGQIADMVMDIYAMESALLRTESLVAERGEDKCAVQKDITRVFVRDAASRIERATRIIAAETDGESQAGQSIIDGLVVAAPFKSIAARRRIADSVIEAGKYHL